MKPAAEKLAAALADIAVAAPAFPVLHNADVAAYSDSAQIKDALVRQLYQPVRWVETAQKMARDGATVMAECGPGKVLTGLVKRIDKSLDGRSLATPADFAGALEEWAN